MALCEINPYNQNHNAFIVIVIRCAMKFPSSANMSVLVKRLKKEQIGYPTWIYVFQNLTDNMNRHHVCSFPERLHLHVFCLKEKKRSPKYTVLHGVSKHLRKTVQIRLIPVSTCARPPAPRPGPASLPERCRHLSAAFPHTLWLAPQTAFSNVCLQLLASLHLEHAAGENAGAARHQAGGNQLCICSAPSHAYTSLICVVSRRSRSRDVI